ncbi:MAG TPA: dTMP kinase [Candidatus Coprenecus stercoravium]|uniref:Thymidylate kinase n=1 Tax=Candidatus Coprenecus stercoravium TaxID=2840735 RepID=A0A9D2GQA9_9BACT|nr:dTMP kinase [Candidatus Coprenecus stercoravium]
MLIVIEGLDGSGKSTQVARVSEYLKLRNGSEPEYLHFPRFDAPVVGDMIARFLRGEFGRIDQVHPMIAALLFAEDRRDASGEIRKWLDEGRTVLLDRYVYSNIAFQCAKIDDADRSLELQKWILDTEYGIYGIPRPDLNIFLDVPVSFVEDRLTHSREGSDREYLHGGQDIHEADMSFQKRVREVYLRLCGVDPGFMRIDCSDDRGRMLPEDKVFDKIREVL